LSDAATCGGSQPGKEKESVFEVGAAMK